MAALSLELGAGLAEGLMIGIERGWRLRRDKPGTRVAGVRTYTLLGIGGALAGLTTRIISPFVAAILASALVVSVLVGFAHDVHRRDATGAVASVVVIGLGLLAGAGQPALAVAGGAIVTLILATRNQSHQFVEKLNATDVQALARYAVIAAAVLPFLPDRSVGPLGAWNPFQLWLVVVLITGFSFAGYIANRTVGERKGVLAAALIGGAYSSTAVTQSLARRLGQGEQGPLSAGILIATAVMYVRIAVLIAILSSSTFLPFVAVTAPASVAGIAIGLIAWLRAPRSSQSFAQQSRNPIEIGPALGFVAIVAIGALATRWAQQNFGQSGTAASLFFTGTFDVDAAIVTLSGLPVNAISRELAAIAIAGTIIANMGFKMFVAAVYAGRRSGRALLGLAASTLVLAVSIAVAFAADFGKF